jgi:hypothetical protein
VAKRPPGPEARVKTAITEWLKTQADVIVWRNNVGVATKPRFVKYGLFIGSADLVGVARGMFIALEVKAPKGKVSPEQVAWLAEVRMFGGVAGVVRAVEDAERLVEEARARASNDAKAMPWMQGCVHPSSESNHGLVQPRVRKQGKAKKAA